MKNGSLNSRQEELEEYDPHIIMSFNGKWIIKFSLGRGQDTPIQVWTKNSNKKEEAIIKINKIFYAKVLETFGSHAGGWSLSHKALIQGYWWPSMQKATKYYVKKCNQCQKYAPNIHQPGGVLNPLSSPWPFGLMGLGHSGVVPKGCW